ncbi:MAG: NUDIX domain-containing protein [Caulobacterales bacterium]|jgi:8-oxo-dGTP pyrophosphatase MutT (NUDIX family)
MTNSGDPFSSAESQVNPWRATAVDVAFENAYLRVDDHVVVKPNGEPAKYGVVHIKRIGVGVLPLHTDGSVSLVGQWRFALGRYSWEMPEGGAEPGEDLAATAHRELEEEAGLRAGTLLEVLRMDMSNSLTDELCVVFLAFDLTPGEMAPDDTEVFSHARVPFKTALDAALDGRITDALTVAALLRAHHMAFTGGLPVAISAAMLAIPKGELDAR